MPPPPVILLLIPLLTATVVALAAPHAAQAQTLEHATASFAAGDATGALAETEQILARTPEDVNTLYLAASINFQLGNIDVARGRLERVVRLAGNFAAAWELMAQIHQAQNEPEKRDEAIRRMKIAINSAIDPRIRRTSTFIRDRIHAGGKLVVVADHFGRGGSDFTRYQFSIADPLKNPDTGLILRTDAATTESWAATALLPRDQPLFHLDMVDVQDNGERKIAIYEYYVGEPDYDKVRATVIQILRGEIQPLSGAPGSLSGLMKK